MCQLGSTFHQHNCRDTVKSACRVQIEFGDDSRKDGWSYMDITQYLSGKDNTHELEMT